MDHWIINLVEKGGYWGIAFLMALENIIPPIPSELIMGLGGALVLRGAMQFWPLLIAGTIGTTIGNYMWFLIGDRIGYERLRPIVDRWGRWLTLDWHSVERCGEFLRRHGQWVVFILRFSPVARTMISLPAGMAHMRHARFLVFTFAGAAIWNALLIVGGRWLARTMTGAEHWIIWVGAGITVVAFGIYLWRVITWKPHDRTE